MRNCLRILACLIIATAVVSPAMAAGPEFIRKPVVACDGEKVKISFSVSAATDVEVAIVDGGGRVIRHLAAGQICDNAPTPLSKDIAQELIWDGKDDDGKPVAGPTSVRVRLGLGAKLNRMIPAGAPLSTATALGVGPSGELYVLSNRGHASVYLYVLDRDGKYLRTILPSPANLKPEQVKGLERIKLANGSFAPIVYQANAAHFAPFMSGIRPQQLCVTGGGRIVFASGGNDYSDQSVPRHVLCINADGTTPADVGFVGPRLGQHGRYSIGLPAQQLAASPDGKTLYFVGLGIAGTDKKPARGAHAVARLTWDATDEPRPFIGSPDEPGDDQTHLNTPASVTTDGKGNIYVADGGNNRVAVFDPAGKFLGQTKVDRPRQLAVGNNGELYVLTEPTSSRLGYWGPFSVIRFDKAIGGTETSRLDFNGRGAVVALDAGAKKLWLGYDGRPDNPLLPIVDSNGKLTAGPDVLTGKTGELSSPLFIAVDAGRDRLYLGDLSRQIKTVDLKTDKIAPFQSASEAAVDSDGNVYLLSGYGTNTLYRVTPDGKPLPFSATGSNKLTLTYRAGLPHVGVRGLTVAPSGDIYAYQDFNANPMKLSVFGPDGSLKKDDLVANIPADSACGLAVDRQGNVYCGINVQDRKVTYPAELAGQVPAMAWYMMYQKTSGWYSWPQRDVPPPPWSRAYLNFYLYHYGSVLKFAPAGGRFFDGGKPAAGENPRPAEVPTDAIEYRNGYLKNVIWAQGVKWRYRGFALCSNRTESWGDPGCSCWTGRLGIDEFGRLFVPDVFRFSVGVLDNAGNELTRFGRYGNFDSAGPGSAIPGVDIPLAWANCVAVGGGRAYISDRVNRRVVVVDLTHAAEEICQIK